MAGFGNRCLVECHRRGMRNCVFMAGLCDRVWMRSPTQLPGPDRVGPRVFDSIHIQNGYEFHGLFTFRIIWQSENTKMSRNTKKILIFRICQNLQNYPAPAAVNKTKKRLPNVAVSVDRKFAESMWGYIPHSANSLAFSCVFRKLFIRVRYIFVGFAIYIYRATY